MVSTNEKEKNLANSKKDIDKVTEHALHAAVVGNGTAAEETARRIDKEFILIRRSDLPVVEEYYSHTRGADAKRARTSTYYGGKPDRYFQRALDFLAIAQVAEQEQEKQAERELAGKRSEAFRMLHPNMAPMWCYQDLTPETKKQVDVVVGLMTQVDELKDKK
jgi:hypothetical protein